MKEKIVNEALDLITTKLEPLLLQEFSEESVKAVLAPLRERLEKHIKPVPSKESI